MATTPTIHVRRATQGDAPDIARLALEIQAAHVAGRPDLFKPGGVEPIDIIASRMTDPRQLYWVATNDERTIGYAYARDVEEPESLWRYAARTIVLDQIGVMTSHRSRGVGSALWQAVRETAMEQRADRVILNVWAFNSEARRFYERLGFTPFHERLAFELGAHDARSQTAVRRDVLDVVPGSRGHFRFESGHHSDRWLDLDALFVDAGRVAPSIDELAARLRPHEVTAVCGPLTGGAFLAQAVATRLGAGFYFTDRTVPPNDDELYRVAYTLRPSLATLVRGQRVAIVDDVVSAGSASRGTFASLVAAGARPVVVGALLLIGRAARQHFEPLGVAVEAVSETDGALWRPGECPLCAAGVPIVDRSG
jgi:orotate phosphoribosyltransferase